MTFPHGTLNDVQSVASLLEQVLIIISVGLVGSINAISHESCGIGVFAQRHPPLFHST